MKYCVHCGKELFDEAVICPGCGCAAQNNRSVVSATDANGLVIKLSEKERTNGIIWMVIGILQVISGLFVSWWILAVGVMNILASINDIQFSKTVLENPKGIIKRYEPLAGPIIALIYNLVIGGIIGVVGSVYYFVAIRSFVMENKEAFASLDT